MSTNKTTVLTMHSWTDTDYFRWTELNENFDKLDALFHASTGHSHNGTAGNGPKIAPANVSTDASNRFVTDTEKSTWNAKQAALSGDVSGHYHTADRYTHPSGDGNSHIPVTSTTNNGKFLKAGATANSFAWTSIAATDITEDTSHKFITDAERTAWNAKQSALSGNVTTHYHDADKYTHPTTDGNLHVPVTSTTNGGKFLKAGATAGSFAWTSFAISDIPLDANNRFVTDAEKSTWNAKQSALSGDVSGHYHTADRYTHPSGDGNLHVPANSTTNSGKYLKASATAGSYLWTAIAATDVTEDTSHKFITDAERTAWNAKQSALSGNVTTHYHDADKYTHPSTDGSLHVPATSTTNSGKFLKAGATAGSMAWTTLAISDIPLDASNRFVTDTEKSYWSGKQDALSGNVTGHYHTADQYTHPTGDGNSHIPATSTTNSGKFLKAGATANSFAWTALAKGDVGLGNVDNVQQAPMTRNIAAGAGLSGGGTMAADRTISMGTPSTLTPTSTNSASGTTHTHALDIATLAEAQAGTSTAKFMTPQRTADAIAALQAVDSVDGQTGAVVLSGSYEPKNANIQSHIGASAPHSGHISHSLAAAANDFLVASGVGAFVKKTLAEVKSILGLGSAAYTSSSDYATASGLTTHAASTSAHGVDTKAMFKNGTGTFGSGATTCTITDSFITANTMVIVSPTGTKLGNWTVDSAAGSFTITSDITETSSVTFDWGAVK